MSRPFLQSAILRTMCNCAASLHQSFSCVSPSSFLCLPPKLCPGHFNDPTAVAVAVPVFANTLVLGDHFFL